MPLKLGKVGFTILSPYYNHPLPFACKQHVWNVFCLIHSRNVKRGVNLYATIDINKSWLIGHRDCSLCTMIKSMPIIGSSIWV